MNPSKRLGNANLEVIGDVYNSIHLLTLTLQCDHVHVLELSRPTSTNVTKRRQIDHRECVGECVGLLSREQGSFKTNETRGKAENQISEGREI